MNLNETDNLISVIFNDLTITFTPTTQNKSVIFELPKNAVSSVIREYLDEYITPYLPGGNKYDNSSLGKNIDSITDIYLDFADIEKDPSTFHLQNTNIKPIKFNTEFGKEYEKNLKPIMLKGLTFKLSFSEFTMINIEQGDVATNSSAQTTLTKFFNDILTDTNNKIMNLQVSDINYTDYTTADNIQDNLNESKNDMLKTSRVRAQEMLDGKCNLIIPTSRVEFPNDVQYCFIYRDSSRHRIDLTFFSKEDIEKNPISLKQDFRIGKTLINKTILKMKPGESTICGQVYIIRCDLKA